MDRCDWIFGPEFLDHTASQRDGLSRAEVIAYHEKSARFIVELVRELKFPRMVASTAQVYLHRFFAVQSFKQHNRFIISTAAVFLAAKAEEAIWELRRPLPRMAQVYVQIRDLGTSDMKDIEGQILIAERILLQTLCFDLRIIHPFQEIIEKMKSLKSHIPEDSRKDFYQSAINFLNDSFYTTLCLQYQSSHIAMGAIFVAALHLSLQPVKHPRSSTEEPSWLTLLDESMDSDVLKNICTQILDCTRNVVGNPVAVAQVMDFDRVSAQLELLLPSHPGSAPSSASRSDVTDSEVATEDERGTSVPPPPSDTLHSCMGLSSSSSSSLLKMKSSSSSGNVMDVCEGGVAGGREGEERGCYGDDDDHMEVNLDDEYPYEDRVQSSRPVKSTQVSFVTKPGSAASTAAKSAVAAAAVIAGGLPAASPKSRSHSYGHEPGTDSPPPPPPDTPPSTDTPVPPPPPDTPHSSLGTPAPPPPPDTPHSCLGTPAPPPPPDTPHSCLGTPAPPPPPDTPTSSRHESNHRAGEVAIRRHEGGDTSPPPPPPPDTPESKHGSMTSQLPLSDIDARSPVTSSLYARPFSAIPPAASDTLSFYSSHSLSSPSQDPPSLVPVAPSAPSSPESPLGPGRRIDSLKMSVGSPKRVLMTSTTPNAASGDSDMEATSSSPSKRTRLH